MLIYGQVKKINTLDLMSRCKARTFRVSLMAALFDFEPSELVDKIKQAEKAISSDERFRKEVRKLVKEFETKAQEEAI